jgi:hypothetical protein
MTKLVSRFPAAGYPLLAPRSLICRNRIAIMPPLRHSCSTRCSILATFSAADALQAVLVHVANLTAMVSMRPRSVIPATLCRTSPTPIVDRGYSAGMAADLRAGRPASPLGALENIRAKCTGARFTESHHSGR